MKKWVKRLSWGVTVLVGAVVGAWFWLAPPSASNTLMFHGGTIITMDPALPTAEAILVRDGKIIALGALSDMRMQGTGATPIDLNGNTLMPGFIEPHSHPIAAAQFAATIDVSGFSHTSRAGVMQTLQNEIDDAPGDWAIAFGWDPVMIDDLTAPTLPELDALSPDRPLLILTQMMHDAYANSAALAAAGIGPNTPNPPAGEFVRDAAGTLTGTIREVGAINALFAAIPRPPKGTNDLLLNLMMGAYARAGYTTVGVLGPVGNDADPIGLLKRRAAASNLVQPVIYALPGQLGATATPEARTDIAPVVGVKFWMDGSPYAGGAAVREPYEVNALTTDRLHLKPGHVGAVMIPAEDYRTQFTEYHTRGYQIATHVQGENAVERVLDVAEQVLAAHPRPNGQSDHRHRLEHNALITKAQLERAQALGFTTSFFIDHIRFYGHKLPALFGEARTDRYMPTLTAQKTGHVVTVHSDTPATPLGPLRSIVTLMERKPNRGDAPIGAEERLTRMEALKAITINAAWQLGLEDTRGSLSIGKQADMVMLTQDLTTVPVDQIEATEVVATWINGQPVDARKTTLMNARLLWDVLVN